MPSTLSVVLLAVLAASAYASSYNTTLSLLDRYDTSGDGQLNEAEVEAMLSTLLDDHPGHCPNATELIQLSDTNADDLLSVTEAQSMAYILLPCLEEYTCGQGAALNVTVLGEVTPFTCLVAGHDEHEHEEEEEHEHEHGEEEEEVSVEMLVAGVLYECTGPAHEEAPLLSKTAAEKWGYTIIAVTIVTVIALVGIVFFVTHVNKSAAHLTDDFAALAVGALLGGAIYHMIPEAVAVNGFTWKMSTVIMAGFMFAYVVEVVTHLIRAKLSGRGECQTPSGIRIAVSAFTHHHDDHTSHKHPESDVEKPDNAKPLAVNIDSDANLNTDKEDAGLALKQEPFSLRKAHPVVWVVLIGDLFHNVVDGIAIAAAFLSCSNSVGWSVMAAVIFHEVPQELGDYLVLVKHGVPKHKALLFNFISALSCYVGAIAVLAASSQDEAVNAYLVAFSAGVLLFIGSTDVLPSLLQPASVKPFLRQFFFITVGLVALGLTLLHDEHCEAGGAHAHAH